MILDGIWRQPFKLYRMLYWCHLGKASYFLMFRSSFRPIPPKSQLRNMLNSSLYSKLKGTFNLNSPLLGTKCFVVPLLLGKQTTQNKTTKPNLQKTKTPNILTFKELCLFQCLFSAEPVRVSAESSYEPFISFTLCILRANCQFPSAWACGSGLQHPSL